MKQAETETIRPAPETQPQPEAAPGAVAPDMSALENIDLDHAGSIPGQETAPAASQQIPTKDFLQPAFYGMFSALAPNWQIEKAECEMLAEVWSPVIDRYFPNLPESPLMVAVGATAVVFMPRIGKPRRVRKAPPGQQGDTSRKQEQPPQKPEAAPETSRND